MNENEKTEQPEKIWYSASEAAEYLGVNLNRLGHLRRQGRVKGITNEGKNPRYSMYHIDELRKANISDLRKKDDEEEPDVGQKQGKGSTAHQCRPLKSASRWQVPELIGA